MPQSTVVVAGTVRGKGGSESGAHSGERKAHTRNWYGNKAKDSKGKRDHTLLGSMRTYSSRKTRGCRATYCVRKQRAPLRRGENAGRGCTARMMPPEQHAMTSQHRERGEKHLSR